VPLCRTPAFAQAGVSENYRWLTFAVFAAVIAITMYVTYLAAKRVRSASDFYTAGGGVSGLQNGWAIAGDYLSAASFLGIAGLISLYGYDGFMYSVGWLVAYITVLLLIAEPCRNIGRYTLSDILAYRNDPQKTRIVGALSTITVSTFYLTAQMVGGGVLVKTLIGINYETSVIAVGVLMLAYVLFGGMVATTWVQIIKAVLLVTASIVIVCWCGRRTDSRCPGFLADVVADPKVQARVATLLGDPAKTMSAAELGQRFLEPGLYFKAPIDQISLGMALVFGTAGLPHILMRFFTVRTAQQARRSVVWAMVDHRRLLRADAVPGLRRRALRRSGQYRGGGCRRQHGRSAARAVHRRRTGLDFRQLHAGVRLGGGLRHDRRGGGRPGAGLASAMAHDLFVGVIRAGKETTPRGQVLAARVATLIVGAMSIGIGIAAKGQNVAVLVGLAFAVAASANFPCVLLTLYWKRCNTGGIVTGMLVGTIAAVGLTLVSPNLTYPKAVKAAAHKVLDAAPAKRAAATRRWLRPMPQSQPRRPRIWRRSTRP
jgi:cation/acetate symporter